MTATIATTRRRGTPAARRQHDSTANATSNAPSDAQQRGREAEQVAERAGGDEVGGAVRAGDGGVERSAVGSETRARPGSAGGEGGHLRSALHRRELAEEPGDPLQAAVRGQLADVQAAQGDLAVGADELPGEAQVVVVRDRSRSRAGSGGPA